MKFVGHYRLPGIATGMSGERKVFTQLPLAFGKLWTLSTLFSPCLKASGSLDTWLFGTMVHSVDLPLPVSIPYLFHKVNDLLDK